MPLHFAGDVGSDITNPTAVTAATSTALDMSTGNNFRITMGTTITTLTITNPPPTTAVCRLKIVVVQDATGTRLITTWPSNMRFTGSANPTLTATASKQDVFEFLWDTTALLWLEQSRDLAVAAT